MRGVDHQLVRLTRFGHQGREDTFENCRDGSIAQKVVVERLVRAVAARCVPPLQAIADDVDDAADDRRLSPRRQST